MLAINLSEEATTEPTEYIVANEGLTGHSGSLNPQLADTQYLHSGRWFSKTGNQCQFSLAEDRFYGDELQDAVLGLVGIVSSVSESQLLEIADIVPNTLVMLGIVTDPTTLAFLCL